MNTLYPTGYGTQMVTLAELRRRHEPHMHPEYARRVFPWIETQGGLVGIGSGFRKLGEQPNRPGFAPEGQSFHQPQAWPDAPGCYAALDLVVINPGGKHRSPRWQEMPHRGNTEAVAWGLHCNVYPSEPWHLQAIEVSGWRTWVARGRPGLRAGYPIPGTVGKVFAPKPTQRKRTRLTEAQNDKAEVARLQNVCVWWGWHDDHNRPPLADGNFGALTEQSVQSMQRALGIVADGVYGRQSAAKLQAFLDAMAALTARAAG